MATAPQYERILKTAIDEQRHVYDWSVDNYRQVRNKTTVYLGAGLATLAFLYTHPNKNGVTFIPFETYGKIFYFLGLGLLLASLSLLAINLKSVMWEFPTEDKVLEKLKFDSYLEYLEYIKEKYRECYRKNIKHCEDKHRILHITLPMLITGGIILAVLNIFTG
jgi:hypothetical protein